MYYNPAMRNPHSIVAALLVAACCSVPARAWHDEGHLYAALAGVEALPEDVPAFFREDAKVVAHLSIDPDVWRNALAPQLGDATTSDHYIDMEFVEDLTLPPTRSEFVKLCYDHELNPQHVGYLPYAIMEGAQKLALAFAEYRADPSSEAVKMKCLVYAGVLSHFTADLHMPLHTSLHYDGMRPRNPDGSWGSSPRTGVHARIDALPTWLPYNVIFVEPLTLSEVDGELMPFVMRNIDESHALLETAYALEPKLPGRDDTGAMDPAVKAFTIDRERASARFTGEVFLYAWRLSGKIELSDWLDRDTLDNKLNRDEVPPQPGR